MALPSPPIAAHLPRTSSSPLSSPFPSRPPSPSQPPTSQGAEPRTAYAYPYTPDLSSAAHTPASSAPASRSASLSKDPLLKPRARRGSLRGQGAQGVSAWLRAALSRDGKSEGGGELELEERGRAARRMSAGTAERASVHGGGEGAQRQKRGLRMSKERAQLVVAFAMIALVGMNDSATGANLDAMQEHYGVSYDKISTVFLSNTAGYFLSSISASFLLHHFGLQVSLLVAATSMCIGCVTLSVAPPFPVFVTMLLFLGFGSGMVLTLLVSQYDASITTIVSHEEDSVLMSWLYSCFGVGAAISPIMIGAFVDKGYDWNRYYNMPLGLSIILAIVGFFVFRGYEIPPDEAHDATLATAQAPEQTTNPGDGEVIHAREVMSAQRRMKLALRLPSVYVGFVLIICAFAATDTLSAWIVSFMVSKRSSPAAATRFVLAGVWAGIAAGRVVLSWALNRRLGEKQFAIVLLVLACAFLGVLYVRDFVVDAVAVVLAGFFMGPVTPKVLDVVGVRVPPSLKASVMSLTIGLGLIGSSVGPLLFGIAAGRGGLSSLPVVVIGILGVSIVGWFCVPPNRRRED
ncbi:hypothetical protein JCM10449v2_007732 [Rhodotorula kratochvilovae]